MSFLEYLEEKGYPNTLLRKIFDKHEDYVYHFRIKGKLQIAPKWELKILQKILKDYITDNYASYISNFATAYIKKENISYNVSKHFGRNYFYVTDFSNFFPSIKLTNIKDYLSSIFKDEDSSSLDIIFNIGFYSDSLQFGFPSSPIISNIVMTKFDNLLFEELKTKFPKNNIAYSRYCDDLTISSKYEISPKIINNIINSLLIKEYTYLSINKRKTRSFEKYSQYPYITGLIPLKDRTTIGKKRFNILKLNIYLSLKNKKIKNTDLFDTDIALSSYLSYVYLVDPHNYNRLKEYFSKRFKPLEIKNLFKK
ncbi:hypothetical protein CRV01_00185 [Arcobacter sp. CECT 8983]|uniref:reverse transcriptase domain-containing protein n=1 Tax=Arcobacter sp. CECT 8983 TaxID=2044508 RepID=UPI00100BFDBE|nr:reverse transcriptase domain-containing protein [Arcobacter sp. CECT 8983]RXJ91546.1 hypothetical protein CRV01_00185 [Arcobacter sp. CECT 8983]